MKHLTLILLLVFGACSSKPLDVSNPQNVDFTGVWILDSENSDVVPDMRNRPVKPPRRRIANKDDPRIRSMIQAGGSGIEFVVHDFEILRAERLDIEQNRDSMGVRYHPGVYRDISWGERQRGLWEVRAGWEEGNLIVESEANNLTVVETHRRERDYLVVDVAIRADGEDFAFKRVFDRLTR